MTDALAKTIYLFICRAMDGELYIAERDLSAAESRAISIKHFVDGQFDTVERILEIAPDVAPRDVSEDFCRETLEDMIAEAGRDDETNEPELSRWYRAFCEEHMGITAVANTIRDARE